MTSNLLQDWGLWIDYAFLLMLGGIPWQCYYQRVLSSKTSKRAVLLSYGGGLIALIMTIPSVIISLNHLIKFGFSEKATKFEKILRRTFDKSVVFCARNSVLVKKLTKIFQNKCGQVVLYKLYHYIREAKSLLF